MLHVTSGSEAARRLALAGLPGAILTWDDVLHEGPVPAAPGRGGLSRLRAEFIASCGWAPIETVRRHFAERDAALAAATGEVVLWFEHDLYDQLQLLHALDHLQGRHVQVSAVHAGDYLSRQTPARLAAWFVERTGITDAQWTAARRAWAAFRAPDPRAIVEMLPALTALPHLPAALRRHLQQFPSCQTGLSRTEGQALAVLAAGPLPLRALFEATQALEGAMFMGDTTFRWHLDAITGDDRLVASSPASSDDAGTAVMHLTLSGEAVLRGDADRLDVCALDRWLGGAHLQAPGPTWRWDEGAGRIRTT